MIRFATGCGWIVATLALVCAARADDAPSTSARQDPPKKTLDLKPADIRKLFTPEQINRVLSNIVDPDIEGVEVEATREKLIFDEQPWWQTGPSWLLPRPEQDATRSKKYGKPDATFPYARPPAASPAPMAGEMRGYDR